MFSFYCLHAQISWEKTQHEGPGDWIVSPVSDRLCRKWCIKAGKFNANSFPPKILVDGVFSADSPMGEKLPWRVFSDERMLM